MNEEAQAAFEQWWDGEYCWWMPTETVAELAFKAGVEWAARHLLQTVDVEPERPQTTVDK